MDLVELNPFLNGLLNHLQGAFPNPSPILGKYLNYYDLRRFILSFDEEFWVVPSFAPEGLALFECD